MKKEKDQDKDFAEKPDGELSDQAETAAELDPNEAPVNGETDLEEELASREILQELQASLEEARSKADEYLDGWQRARAEFANYKKRVLKENTDIRQVARGEVIKIYLDIVDDLKRALREVPQQEELESWSEGIEIIYQKLLSRLQAEGVKPMEALGEDFDPTIHEALMTEENDEYESGKIIEVMQEGYWLGDKVLRPALVRVAA